MISAGHTQTKLYPKEVQFAHRAVVSAHYQLLSREAGWKRQLQGENKILLILIGSTHPDAASPQCGINSRYTLCYVPNTCAHFILFNRANTPKSIRSLKTVLNIRNRTVKWHLNLTAFLTQLLLCTACYVVPWNTLKGGRTSAVLINISAAQLPTPCRACAKWSKNAYIPTNDL